MTTAARIKTVIVPACRGSLPRWLCQKLCRDQFFNRDASLEIDRLVIEIEKLRAEGKR